MDGMEDKLNSILGDPAMMQKIMAMAQSLGSSAPQEIPPLQQAPPIDLGMVQTISGLMSKTNIDRDQQALLSALVPYLSAVRIQKLENAMRAAKMAGFAATALQQGGGMMAGR